MNDALYSAATGMKAQTAQLDSIANNVANASTPGFKRSSLRFGDLMATSFSNVMESHKSSKGFFRVGEQIQTALHGPSLLLDGLERGINDNARAREIIIHGAWYAAESFIQQYGYCGKSFGCPALPDVAMKKLLPILANGSLLYIYAK